MFSALKPVFLSKLSALVIFILFTNIFLFHQLGGSALALIIITSFVLLSFLFPSFVNNQKKRYLWLGFAGFILLIALSLVKTASFFPNLIAFLSGIFILCLYLYLASKNIIFISSLMELILTPVMTIFTYFGSIGKTIKAILSINVINNKTKSTKPSIPWVSLATGMIISVPVLFILLGLLTAGDPVYGKFVDNSLQFLLTGKLWQHLLFSLILFVCLLPLLFLFGRPEFASPLQQLARYSVIIEVTVVMVITTIVLGSFLIVQWPYVFVTVAYETDLSRFGVATYSEYVRRGFIELLMATIWVYGLVWLGLIAMRNKAKSLSHSVLNKVQLVVLAQLALLILSVFRRIWLYQNLHGWSLVRIYGGIILFWILGMAVFLALRHRWQKPWVIPETIFSGLLVLFILFFNSEHFIASTHPPTVNKRIDYLYLSRMSADGYKGWRQSYDNSTEILQAMLEKPFLSKDERREVAYAGIIASNLTLKYSDLLEHYGSATDKIAFYKTLLDYQMEANQTMASWITNTQQEEAQKNQILADLDIEFNLIRQLKETVQAGKYQEIYKYLSWVYPNYPTGSFYNYNFTFSFIQITDPNNQFFIKKDELDNMDKIFTWNFAEKAAFKQMKKDMPIQNLVNLQRNYFDLYRRISTQVNGERDYEVDVSLNSPLL